MEQDKTLKALQMAIQMEIDGKQFYLRASQSSANQLGRELFRSLAAEEDLHCQRFDKIYDDISHQRAWPKTYLKADPGPRLRTIFGQAAGEIGPGIKVATSELDAVKTAMDMENKTYDFYQDRCKHATYDAERDYYQALAAEERQHYLVLLDYHDYLSDPATWFASKEHSSLDGG